MIPGLKYIQAFQGAGSSGVGGGGGLSLSFINSSNAQSSIISLPSGAVAGDWALLFDMAHNSGSSSISAVTPSGWTTIANTVSSGNNIIRMMVSHVVLTAGMIGASVTGMNAEDEKKIILLFRPSTSILTKTASTWNGEVTTGNAAAQSVTASGVATPLVVAAFSSSSSSTDPAFTTETPAMTNMSLSNSDSSIRIGYTLYNASPSDQSIDIADVGSMNGLQSGYVRFT